mmetsp:Transcript_2529/g.10084  ORF Transcript_2529/g.10084 Transcript_2529/m.10084 type:complete len:221 (-) Transcript_2529:1814-2476(-)
MRTARPPRRRCTCAPSWASSRRTTRSSWPRPRKPPTSGASTTACSWWASTRAPRSPRPRPSSRRSSSMRAGPRCTPSPSRRSCRARATCAWWRSPTSGTSRTERPTGARRPRRASRTWRRTILSAAASSNTRSAGSRSGRARAPSGSARGCRGTTSISSRVCQTRPSIWRTTLWRTSSRTARCTARTSRRWTRPTSQTTCGTTRSRTVPSPRAWRAARAR